MSWSYSTALATAKDQIRLLVGDTNTADQLLQDEEITFIASQESGIYRGAAACCRTIAGLFARRVQRQVGDLRLSSQQQYEHYSKLSKEYLRRAVIGDTTIFAGGLSISGKADVEADTDRVEPAFTKTTGDIPGSMER